MLHTSTVQRNIGRRWRLVALGVLAAMAMQQSSLYLLCHLWMTGGQRPAQTDLARLDDSFAANIAVLDTPFACESPFVAGRPVSGGASGTEDVRALTDAGETPHDADQDATPCPVCLQNLPDQPRPVVTQANRLAPQVVRPELPVTKFPLTTPRTHSLSARAPPHLG